MFKNWKAICGIPDQHFMLAMALLDLTGEFGQKIAGQLPEFFSEELTQGPFPLSTILTDAEENRFAEEGEDGGEYNPQYWSSLIQEVKLEFTTESHNLPYGAIMFPDDLKTGDIGEVVEWRGKKLVYMGSDCDSFYYLPLELVVIDHDPISRPR